MELTKEYLIGWQNDLVKTAKTILVKQGGLPSTFVVLTTVARSRELNSKMFGHGHAESLNEPGPDVKPDDFSEIVIPISKEPISTATMLAFLISENDEKAGGALRTFLKETSFLDDADRRDAALFMLSKVEPNWEAEFSRIIATYISVFANKVGALAICQLLETYTFELPKSVKEELEAKRVDLGEKGYNALVSKKFSEWRNSLPDNLSTLEALPEGVKETLVSVVESNKPLFKRILSGDIEKEGNKVAGITMKLDEEVGGQRLSGVEGILGGGLLVPIVPDREGPIASA